MSFLHKIFGDPNAREVEKIHPVIFAINGLESKYTALSDDELKIQTSRLREELKVGQTLDDILPEAFACVREAGKRVLGMRHFDVQLMGGIFLHRGTVIEMKTGEGKTLVATLPLYLNALSGKGAHLVTVNDYLARRDAEWMGMLYDFLGLTVGCVQQQGVSYVYDREHEEEIAVSERERKQREIEEEGKEGEETSAAEEVSAHVQVEMRHLRPVSRREAYACDITYGTNNEFGFDYLRDNMVQEWGGKVQRELSFAIVDEVDSILIDEARTPLIISAPAEESTAKYYEFAQLVTRLSEKEDYNIDEKMRATTLTEAGIAKLEQWLGMGNIYVDGGIETVHHIEQALKAHALFKRDRDYVIKDGEVIIVDEFTGRLMFGRRYSEGLHQAIEAKERVDIKRESQTMATITFQNLFRLYKKLSGMTGTAITEAEEFHKIYNLEVVVIPTNRSVVRKDFEDRIYKTEAGKFKAVVEDIKVRHEKGQPVLVGTISIDKNEILSEMLKKEGIPHEILNAKYHEKEAFILAQAGRFGAVTVATNMAGRGVDIILGGSLFDAAEAERVREHGGLHVLGTERHEARRIDNQLRGRSGRQGDPGSSQFYVSCEDDLMRIFGSDRIKKLMTTFKIAEDVPIENKLLSKSLESAQRRVEGYHFDTRKHLVEYDDVMNKQRAVIYKKRDEVLLSWKREQERQNGTAQEAQPTNEASNEQKDLADIMMDMIEDEIRGIVVFHTAGDDERTWNKAEIIESIQTIFPLSEEERMRITNFHAGATGKNETTSMRESLIEELLSLSNEKYTVLEKEIEVVSGSSLQMREIEKNFILRAIDSLWVEHLEAMQHLRTGIGLRGYGQRDPLVEYKKESFQLFHLLLDTIQEQVSHGIYKVSAAAQIAPSIIEKARQILTAPAKTSEKGSKGFESATNEGVSEDEDRFKGVGRNDPCPCGAKNVEGKPIKYKKCHGK
jgi:preprotein translocase subunit SecA